MNNRCPKCGKKLSPFYLKQNCPNCKVDLLYYKLDERLEADALEAARQERKIKDFVNILKTSSFDSPLKIIRFILFFTPLAAMCLPVYGSVSLISLVAGIIGGSFSLENSLLPVISMGAVVVISLAVIISSLFSSAKGGLARNLVFSALNLAVLGMFGIVTGNPGAGWYAVCLIYILEIVMHILCDRQIKSKIEK